MLSKAKLGLFAFLFCSFIFFTILLFGHPIYNSGDDVYLLYLLGGGFGEACTNLLHYNFGMHPLLGWIIKNLFIQFPDINWYSVLLYAMHFLSCWIILRIFLSTKSLFEAIVIFSITIFVFESHFLLNLTFTNTALISAMAGLLLFLYESSKIFPANKIIGVSVVLIIISSMFRLHTLIPLLVICSPVIVVRLFQKSFLLSFSIGVACVAIFFLIYYQQQYYSNKIPGWKMEEAYRSTVFAYYNLPENYASQTQDSTVVSFLHNGLFWDKQFLSANKIQESTQEKRIKLSLNRNIFFEFLYWLFVNSRIFWISLMLILITTLLTIKKTNRIVSLSCLGLLIVLMAYLLFFRKLPFYLIPALILFYILVATLLPQKEDAVGMQNRSIKIIKKIFFIALLLWSMVRIQKTISFNKEKNALFVCAWKELNASPDKLFIITDDHFPIDYFSVWDTPKKFLIKNLLYKDEFLNNTYQPIYNRFFVTCPKDFIAHSNIIFIGKKIPAIEHYYKEVWKLNVHFSSKDLRFICFEASRVSY